MSVQTTPPTGRRVQILCCPRGGSKEVGGGGVRVGRHLPPPLFGANVIHFPYKVLGKISVQLEPFCKIPFKATTPLKK